MVIDCLHPRQQSINVKTIVDQCFIHFARCQASCVAVTTALALMIQKNPRHMKKSGKYDVDTIIDESFMYSSRLLATDKQVILDYIKFICPVSIYELVLDSR